MGDIPGRDDFRQSGNRSRHNGRHCSGAGWAFPPARRSFPVWSMRRLFMPEVITGLSLLLLFVSLGFDRGFWTVILAHITFSMCYSAVVVSSRLVTFDISLEEAAMDLGASRLGTFFQVTLPIILPAVLSAWLLSFTLSLDDLVIASFASGPGATTLPMKIYSQVRLGVTPEINALSTILVILVSTGVIVASLLTKRREVRRRREERAAIAEA